MSERITKQRVMNLLPTFCKVVGLPIENIALDGYNSWYRLVETEKHSYTDESGKPYTVNHYVRNITEQSYTYRGLYDAMHFTMRIAETVERMNKDTK